MFQDLKWDEDNFNDNEISNEDSENEDSDNGSAVDSDESQSTDDNGSNPSTPKSKKRQLMSDNGSSAKRLKHADEKSSDPGSTKSFFQLQVDGLLEELKLKAKRSHEYSEWINSFKKFLPKIPQLSITYSDLQTDTKNILKTKKNKKNSEIINKLKEYQFNHYSCDEDVEFNFSPPSECVEMSNLTINVSDKKILEKKISVEIPESYFRKLDYLNNRYFVKRFYYLLYIGIYLEKSNICASIKNEFYSGNKYQNILVVTPKNTEKVRIRIFVHTPDDVFKLSRFSPSTKNLKDKFTRISDIPEKAATSLYNSTILHDLTLKRNNVFVDKTLLNNDNITNALKLLKCWFSNRRLTQIYGGFFDEHIIYVICYLILKNKVTSHMNVQLVLKSFWNFLITSDWTKDSVYLCEDFKINDIQDYHKRYNIVFIDVTGKYNLVSFLSESVYRKIKAESYIALKCLEEDKYDMFEDLFLKKLDVSIQYDSLVRYLKDYFILFIIYSEYRLM